MPLLEVEIKTKYIIAFRYFSIREIIKNEIVVTLVL